MNILAIDSGADQGWAGLERHTLSCGLGAAPRGATWDLVVVEYPVMRPGSLTNANNLITQSLRAGLAAGRSQASTVVFVKPETWKGQLTKEVTANRWLHKYDCHEWRAIAWRAVLTISPGRGAPGDWLAGKRHNVLDALCLLDWAIPRATSLLAAGSLGPAFL